MCTPSYASDDDDYTLDDDIMYELLQDPVYVNDLAKALNDTKSTNGDYSLEIYNWLQTHNYYSYIQNISSKSSSIESYISLVYGSLTGLQSIVYDNLTLIDSDLNDFATQNHTDETKIDTDLLAFKSANHTDITAFMADFDNRYGYQISSIGNLVGVKKNYQDEGYISTGTTTTGNLYYYYHFNNVSSLLNVIVVDIPVRSTSYPDNFDFSLLSPSLGVIPIQYEYIPFAQYVRLYIYDNNLRYRNGDLIIRVTPNNNQTLYYTTASASIGVLNNEFSWLLKDAMANVTSTEYLSHLNYMYSDDDMMAAKDASSEVIDDTLDGFTGQGSAAAKVSDTSSMKGLSGDLRSGLNGGGSVVNATSVLSNNSQFWSWFTQTTSNNINNPYPAPSVRSNSKSSGDQIVDYLTYNNYELQLLLNNGDIK